MTETVNKMTNTRYGNMLYNKNDTIIGRCLKDYGEFAQNELDFLSQFIPKDGVCVDIGANIGTHSLFFANAVGPQGYVIAFEPQKYIFQLLCANISLNDHHNVITNNIAIDATRTQLKFPYVDYRTVTNFGCPTPINGECTVPANALDNFFFPAIDLIKIDVEGNEPSVIASAEKTIRKFQPLIYSEYHPKYHSIDLVKLIQNLDYNVYIHFSFGYNPKNFKNNKINWHEDHKEINIFCVPKSRNLNIDLEKF